MNSTSYLRNLVSYDQVRAVATPEGTRTHVPIPHSRIIDDVTTSLERSGLRVTDSAFELDGEDGQRFFGMLEVRNGANHDDYQTIIGLRNSHDKRFPAGLACGSQVTVCSNLCFSSEIVLARKHTRYILRDLPGLVNKAVGSLIDARVKQDQRIEAYKGTRLSPTRVDRLLIAGMESRIYPARDIPKVLAEFRHPSHKEFTKGGNTAWRFFNAVTENFKGLRIAEVAKRGQRLHGIMDAQCGLIAA